MKIDKRIMDYEARKCLMLYIAWLKTLHNWFHAAHHVSHSASFSGDHVDLFGRIYQEIDEEIDGAIEKAVGLTNDPRLACPILINKSMLVILEKYNSPVYSTQDDIVSEALKIEKDYILFLETCFSKLDEKEMLSLGLNDQLAASANQHETYVYLLQQRNSNAVRVKPERKESV